MDGSIELENTELDLLNYNKDDGFNYRERRHEDWDENYLLYRDKVIYNRLTQRQTVNVPLMKTQIRTLLKDVDDMPVLYYENLDNNKQAEVFKNEYWKYTETINNMELQDIVDKRQVFMFGRSFDQWQIVDGKIKMTVQDPQDILVSRFCDPFDIHSSRYLIHTHIFVPLTTLANNPDYDKGEVNRLIEWHESDLGIVKAKQNEQMLIEKNQKMSDMGVSDIEDPVLGETYVELSLHFVYRDNEKNEAGEVLPEQIFLYVEADGMSILMKKPLEEVIGVTKDHFWRNHFPYVTWADDLERQDFWSDGVADIIRVPNKVLNTWFAQKVENRTLRNFNMHYYDSSLEGFQPQTFEPIPWGWYPIPVGEGKKLSDVFQTVEVPELRETFEDMNFIMGIAEKGTGATSTSQGVQTERSITLGEVELALGEAKERIKGMSKFYTPAWEQRGLLFIKLIEAGHDKLDAVEVYKKGKNSDDIYKKEIAPNDWMTESGYRCKVWSQDEKNENDINSIEKLNAVSTMIPGNPKLEEIKQRKALEFAGLNPDDINAIMELEQAKRDALLSMVNQGVQPSVQMPGMPAPQAPVQPQAPMM